MHRKIISWHATFSCVYCILSSRWVISSWVYCIFAFCFSWGAQMASKGDFQRFWSPFWILLGSLELSLGVTWASLGACCDPLGALGCHQVALWVSLLMLWRYLGISWGHFGGSSQLWAGDPQVKTISFTCFAWILIFFVRPWAWHLELETRSVRLRSSAWDLELEPLSSRTVAWYR